MARKKDALSRIEILVLSTIARRPMHVYELKLELRYRHVRWWAKAEHGHLYAAVARLEKRKDIKRAGGAQGARRVYAVMPQGRARVDETLRALAASPDSTYFDADLFLAGSFLLPQAEVAELLRARAQSLLAQHAEACTLRERMHGKVPLVADLIMDHRVEHLAREAAFAARAADALAAAPRWAPFLGDRSIVDFLAAEQAAVEDEAAPEHRVRRPTQRSRRHA